MTRAHPRRRRASAARSERRAPARRRRCASGSALSSTVRSSSATVSRWLRSSTGRYGQLEVLDRPSEVAHAQPEQPRGRMSLAITTAPFESSTTCAAATDVERRLAQVVGDAPRRPARRGPAPPPARGCARRDGRSTLRNSRRLRSTGVNRSACVISISDFPSSRTPSSSSAKWNRPQDLGLRLDHEVHQRVAADEQIDPARSARPGRGRCARRSRTDAGPCGIRSAGRCARRSARAHRAARPRSGAAGTRRAGRRRAPPRRCRSRRSSPAAGTASSPSTRTSTIASVYASSPDAQPADQTRRGESGGRESISCGSDLRSRGAPRSADRGRSW